MKASAIRMLPTTTRGVHESCLRAFNILQFVKAWLAQGVPAAMLLELIEDMESGDGGSLRAMTPTRDDKSREELAKRLRQLFDEEQEPVSLVVCEEVASRLLESGPGEEEMASIVQSWLEGKPTKEWSPSAIRFAKVLREHVVWVR